MSKKQVETFKKQVTALARKGDYKSGVELAKQALKRDPNEIHYLYQYAKLLGDWADDLPAVRRKKYKQESIAILKKLQKRMNEADETLQWGIGLNYYYQRADFRGMHTWGIQLEKQQHPNGVYAQGVGAALQAQKLHPRAGAKSWAKKSVAAWKRYGLKKEKYYFPHYCLALALAVQRDFDAAMSALKTAARVSKRPVDNEEFADALELIRTP